MIIWWNLYAFSRSRTLIRSFRRWSRAPSVGCPTSGATRPMRRLTPVSTASGSQRSSSRYLYTVCTIICMSQQCSEPVFLLQRLWDACVKFVLPGLEARATATSIRVRWRARADGAAESEAVHAQGMCSCKTAHFEKALVISVNNIVISCRKHLNSSAAIVSCIRSMWLNYFQVEAVKKIVD